jgi:protein-S-isoprenylcysteine O-methyltransferase Ste14
VALALMVVVVVVLAFSDALNAWWIGGPALLLLCIPISMALFSFLAHRQNTHIRPEEQEKRELEG